MFHPHYQIHSNYLLVRGLHKLAGVINVLPFFDHFQTEETKTQGRVVEIREEKKDEMILMKNVFYFTSSPENSGPALEVFSSFLRKHADLSLTLKRLLFLE